MWWIVDGVLADQSGIGGPSISFASGTWTDKVWPLRPAYVDAIVETFKGKSWAVDFQNEVTNYMKSCLCMKFDLYLYQLNCFVKLFFCGSISTQVGYTQGRIHQYGEPWRPPYLTAGETTLPFSLSRGQRWSHGEQEHGTDEDDEVDEQSVIFLLGPLNWAVYSIIKPIL
jgi:hypothetical protein